LLNATPFFSSQAVFYSHHLQDLDRGSNRAVVTNKSASRTLVNIVSCWYVGKSTLWCITIYYFYYYLSINIATEGSH